MYGPLPLLRSRLISAWNAPMIPSGSASSGASLRNGRFQTESGAKGLQGSASADAVKAVCARSSAVVRATKTRIMKTTTSREPRRGSNLLDRRLSFHELMELVAGRCAGGVCVAVPDRVASATSDFEPASRTNTSPPVTPDLLLA